MSADIPELDELLAHYKELKKQAKDIRKYLLQLREQSGLDAVLEETEEVKATIYQLMLANNLSVYKRQTIKTLAPKEKVSPEDKIKLKQDKFKHVLEESIPAEADDLVDIDELSFKLTTVK